MPGKWDGKTRPTNDTYRSNFNDIWKKENKMRVRLLFEPEPGVKCNVDQMFKCYAENYLSDFPQFKFGGFIMMNVMDHKFTKSASGEPFYQFIAEDGTDVLLKQILDYVKINPMHGYHIHVHYSENGENERAVA